MKYVLQAEGVSKSYRDGEKSIDVLQGVDLSLKPGEFASIEGASGVGKSTLLNILGALQPADSGEIVVAGTNLKEYQAKELLHEYRKRHIGFIFQNHYLMPDFTVLENVMIPLLVDRKEVQKAKERATEVLKRVGLGERVNHYPSEISGGESQRAAVARALAGRPSLILADEPTGNLDTANTENFISLLKELRKNDELTILTVTHEAALAEATSKRYRLLRGKLEKITC